MSKLSREKGKKFAWTQTLISLSLIIKYITVSCILQSRSYVSKKEETYKIITHKKFIKKKKSLRISYLRELSNVNKTF